MIFQRDSKVYFPANDQFFGLDDVYTEGNMYDIERGAVLTDATLEWFTPERVLRFKHTIGMIYDEQFMLQVRDRICK